MTLLITTGLTEVLYWPCWRQKKSAFSQTHRGKQIFALLKSSLTKSDLILHGCLHVVWLNYSF